MGNKDSKPCTRARGTIPVVAPKHAEDKTPFQSFGRESKFWFYLRVDGRSVRPTASAARDLHQFIVEKIPSDFKSLIVGVFFLDTPDEALVYCSDFKTAKLASDCLYGKAFSGGRIATSCMPRSESEMKLTVVEENVNMEKSYRSDRAIVNTRDDIQYKKMQEQQQNNCTNDFGKSFKTENTSKKNISITNVQEYKNFPKTDRTVVDKVFLNDVSQETSFKESVTISDHVEDSYLQTKQSPQTWLQKRQIPTSTTAKSTSSSKGKGFVDSSKNNSFENYFSTELGIENEHALLSATFDSGVTVHQLNAGNINSNNLKQPTTDLGINPPELRLPKTSLTNDTMHTVCLNETVCTSKTSRLVENKNSSLSDATQQVHTDIASSESGLFQDTERDNSYEIVSDVKSEFDHLRMSDLGGVFKENNSSEQASRADSSYDYQTATQPSRCIKFSRKQKDADKTKEITRDVCHKTPGKQNGVFECKLQAEVFEGNSVHSVLEGEIEVHDQLKNVPVKKDDSCTTSNDVLYNSANEETESVSDSMTVSSKMSDITEGSRKTKRPKDPFVVFLYNLPPSMSQKKIVARFKAKYPGFKRCFTTKTKGNAVAVFSSAEQASTCAKQMNGNFVDGKKIKARAEISESDSKDKRGLLNDELEVLEGSEKVSGWLENETLSTKSDLNRRHCKDEVPVPLDGIQIHEDALLNSVGDDGTIKQEEHTVVVANLPNFVTNQQLYKEFSQKTDRNLSMSIQRITRTGPKCCEIVFDDKREMESFMRTKHIICGRKLTVRPKAAKNNIAKEKCSNVHRQENKVRQGDEKQKLSRKRQNGNEQKQLHQEQNKQELQQQEQKRGQQNHLQKQQQHDKQHQQEQNKNYSEEQEQLNLVNMLRSQIELQKDKNEEEQQPKKQQRRKQQEESKEYEQMQGQQRQQEYQQQHQHRQHQEEKSQQEHEQQHHQQIQPPVYTVQLRGFSADTTKEQVQGIIEEKCEGIEVLKLVRTETVCYVKLKSQDDCQRVRDSFRGFLFNGEKIRPNRTEPSKKIDWRKLDLEKNVYVAQLQKRRETLVAKNEKKTKDLEKSVPVLKPQCKKISLEEYERREETRKIYEQKKQELIAQRKEFETRYFELLKSFKHQIEEHRSVNNKIGVEEILKAHKHVTEREFRKFEASLPIYAKRSEILETVERNQVVVLVGETGSGKSTQLAQYLAAKKSFGQDNKRVVVTQPRKIAAISLAKRVAEEYGCKVGQEVGYHVGRDKKVNNKTIIKFVTDRILLNEVLKGGETIQQYSCIVIDEAHERSIHTDLLVAMIKRQLTTFPRLKLIVTSATLNTDVFRKYFNYCCLVKVQGRTFPVERVYTKEKPRDYVDSVYEKVVEVCESGEKGDILVFLTQQNEIEKTSEKLQKKLGHTSLILPLHGKLQSDEQQKVFQSTPNGERKIVVATNSAETSITIDGIKIVVDSGMVKEPSFDRARNITTLDVKLVSQSSSKQRSGRAGRTGPGKCYCMFTEEDYNNMEQSTKPEILKMHLGMAVLQLLSLGVPNVEQFDFVESPPHDALRNARESLKLLGALNQDGTLNRLGEEMLELPTEPRLSKALLEGLEVERGCGEDVIIAAALMTSGHDVFYRGDTAERRNECAIQKQEFCQTSGDLLSAIDVYKKWRGVTSMKAQAAWCKENALNSKTLRSAREASNEIREVLQKLRPGLNLEVTSDNVQESLSKCFVAGYFENIAWSFGHERLGYTVLSSNQIARIHPSSVLASLGDQPKWVLFQDIRRTPDNQVFLCNVTPIKLEWLAEVAMHALQYVDEHHIANSRVVRNRIEPVGPELVKAVIGYQGSTIKRIETSVRSRDYRAFCAVECNVEKGVVDVYTTANYLQYASEQVQEVINTKQRELQGFSEVVITNVGNLKILVENNLQTKLIVQPGTFCKLDVFVDKDDKNKEVNLDEVFEKLADAGDVIHDAKYTRNSSDDQKFTKCGNVTYSDANEANGAKSYICCLDESELPDNVNAILLRPSRYERATTQNDIQSSGVKVLVSWFPFPASGRAYIKCKSQCSALEIVDQLNSQVALFAPLRSTLQKKSGDIGVDVAESDDEFTLRKQLENCCTALQIEDVTKITVPSKRGELEVNLDVEKANLVKIMKNFGNVRVINLWKANCNKVRACVVFDDLRGAESIVQKLNGKKDVLGVRAMYVELDGKREVLCDGRVYEKIRKTVDEMKRRNQDVEINEERCHRRMKIIVTGKNPRVVQTVGACVADLITPEIVLIEDATVARLFTSGYGRAKMKQIMKNNGAIIRTNNFGRRIQITGTSDAKHEAREKIEALIQELQKTRNIEVDLRSSDRPVGAIREILKHFGKDLNKLVEGEDCQASMEIRRRKLVLRGAVEAVRRVQTKVQEFLVTLPDSRREGDVNNQCPVCLDEIEEPYLLSLCGHAYCSECVGQYLANVFDTVKSADMLPLKCMYDKCKSPVIKEDYAAFLNTDQNEKLYRVSLECFLIGNDRCKPCPTADCSWVYETTSTPSTFSCPECGVCLCKSCGDSAHELYDTCEAFKATKDPSKSDQLYEKWAEGADTRKCPKCLVMIERNKGCSHVYCTQCKAHICWKCGKYFTTDGSCYAHIETCRK